MPRLNKVLLRKVKAHIIAEPKRYNQGDWLIEGLIGKNAPPCGTQACIGGWGALLSMKKKDATLKWVDVEDIAKSKFGLSDDEATALFTTENQKNYRGRRGVKEACAKIDLLLKDRNQFVDKYLSWRE